MSRSVFSGAPHLSRLFSAVQIDLIERFILLKDFAELIPADIEIDAAADEDARRNRIHGLLSAMSPDRLRIMEAEAARVATMAQDIPDEFMRRIQITPRFERYTELSRMRGAEERSLWAFIEANDLFVASERATQVRMYRDYGKFYEAWLTESPVAMTAEHVDVAALEEEVAARLQLEEGCDIEAIDLPEDSGSRRQVLLAVIAAGPYASHLTVAHDKKTMRITYRPANELLLIYTPSLGKMEVCARDPVDRRALARAFAEETLREDLSNRPLTQRIYDLSRFRQSLTLDIPESETAVVQRAAVTKVEFRLATWTQRLTLQVDVDEDIDAIARRLFGEMAQRLGARLITSIEFCIKFAGEDGRKGTLRFTVSGRNRSSIQSKPEAAKRALGYRLLEAWGVVQQLRDLASDERPTVIGDVLRLYDEASDTIAGSDLDQMGIAVDRLAEAGFLKRVGWDDVVLLDDDVLGPTLHGAEPAGDVGGQMTMALIEDADGHRIDKASLAKFQINYPYLRDEIGLALAPLGIKGRARQLADFVHAIGEISIRSQSVPVFLAHGLFDDKVLERAERMVRSEKALTRGIVLVPVRPRFSFLGAHIVIGIDQHLVQETGTIDREALEITYLRERQAAGAADAVIFTTDGGGAAQLTVPGQEPKIITGPKRVRVIERLWQAYQAGEPGVSTGELERYAGIVQFPQSFGKEDWALLMDRYVCKPKRALWALKA
jgi:hypothetical protein